MECNSLQSPCIIVPDTLSPSISVRCEISLLGTLICAGKEGDGLNVLVVVALLGVIGVVEGCVVRVCLVGVDGSELISSTSGEGSFLFNGDPIQDISL